MADETASHLQTLSIKEEAVGLKGHCCCGKVQYELEASPIYVHGCHCTYCQRETGSALAVNAIMEADKVKSLGEEPEVIKTSSASGLGQLIYRCRHCQIALWSIYAGAGPAIYFIRVGTLDNPDQCPPDIHIYTSTKQSWLTLPPNKPITNEFYDRQNYWSQDSLDRWNTAKAKYEEKHKQRPEETDAKI